MYTTVDFPTKKALRAAVTLYIAGHTQGAVGARPVTVFQPGPFADRAPTNGWVSIEGPHSPKSHTWYARCLLEDGVVVKVT